MKASCKRCGKIEEKVLKKVYMEGSFLYVNLAGKAWGGRLCPACYKETKKARARVLRNQTPLDHTPKDCQLCNRTFIPKRNHAKFCSSHCQKKHHYHKSGKLKAKERQLKIRAYDELQKKKAQDV